ncbi:hypothetical protein J4234_01770 [Candidatus Woesearchaeota archaeon]|nr:hypothetical protein [Candidatus Woesearchaeota archaeon]
MNKLIIIFALALIVSSFAVLGAENTTSTCTDSDGGMNYYEYITTRAKIRIC